MGKEKYKKILGKIKGRKILVIGDVMLDHFIWGRVDRISPEAPVPIVKLHEEKFEPGGAANVAHNIADLGGEVVLIGVIGKDSSASRLKEILKERGIKTDYLVADARRPTTVKTRVIAHSQQVVRIDRENKDKIDDRLTKKAVEKIEEVIKEVDAVAFSDYDKGMANKILIERLLKYAQQYKKIITVDAKPENLRCFKGVTLIAPNQIEAAQAVGEKIYNQRSLEKVGKELLSLLSTQALLITRGEEGMSLFEKGKEPNHIPAVTSEVYDVTGAGDTVIGVLTLALAAKADMLSAVKLANYAAGVVVRKLGTATVTKEEIEEMIKEINKEKIR